MIEINKITELDDKRHIALLDTTSISFMQGLSVKGLQPEVILKDYDLVLIPEWVLTEINDAPGRADYVQKLIEQEYPIYCIEEGAYTDLANGEEGNLYQIVLASTSRLARIRSYLRQYIGKADPLDMDAWQHLLHIVSLMPDGRKLRSISLLMAQPLRLIRDISSRLLGLVLQIRIKS